MRRILFALLLLARVAGAATYTIDDTGNGDDTTPGDGICSTTGCDGSSPCCTLRAALTEVQAGAGGDAIICGLTGGGPYTITESGSALTVVNKDHISLDCTTQSGNTDCGNMAHVPPTPASAWNVTLDANSVVNGGINLIGTGSSVKGVEVKNVAGSDNNGYGVQIGSLGIAQCISSHNNWGGVYFGGTQGQAIGVVAYANNIGGITTTGSNGQIRDSFTGIDRTGAAAPNTGVGVLLESSADANTIDHVIASANIGFGIDLSGATSNTLVRGSLIGRDLTNTSDLCNGNPQIENLGSGTVLLNNSIGTCPLPVGCCGYDGHNSLGATCLDPIVVSQPIPDTATCDSFGVALSTCCTDSSHSNCDPGFPSCSNDSDCSGEPSGWTVCAPDPTLIFVATNNCSTPGDQTTTCVLAPTPTVTPVPCADDTNCAAITPGAFCDQFTPTPTPTATP